MEEPQKNDKSGLSWTQPAPVPPPSTFAQKVEPASVPPVSTPPASASTPGVARYVGVFAGGVVVGVLLAWGFATATERRITAGPNATSTPQSSPRGSGAVVADSQASLFVVASLQPAGSKVAIAKALVTKPTWVVVFDDTDGKPGRALGASLFTVQKQSGTIALLRNTVAGRTYLVGQAVDNGNNTFSLKTDTLVMVDGKQLLAEFSAQ